MTAHSASRSFARTRAPLAPPWLLAMVILSAGPVLKIGDVQAVEMLQLLWMYLALPIFIYSGMRIPVTGIWSDYGSRYLLFLGFCAVVSLLSLRLPFYPPPEVSILKRPLILSVARIFEFLLVICFMILVARTVALRPRLLRQALDAYCWTGLLSAWVSIAAWVLMSTSGISTFLVYGADGRVRGFFNEGGPYGLFLVSVGIVVLLRSRLYRRPHRVSLGIALVTLFIALLLSGSKAGLLAAMILSGIGMAVSGSRKQRLALGAACVTAVVVLLTLFPGKLLGYAYVYLNFEEALAYRPGDPSLVMGRVTAAIIIPRMISAHPILGIGVGNYSLMRNDPDYLQGLPSVDAWDLPGAGLFGSAAEFGIPLTLAFAMLLLQPLLRAKNRRAPTIVIVTAAFQPVAFLLGVNPNFFYPWLTSAFVIALELVARRPAPCSPAAMPSPCGA